MRTLILRMVLVSVAWALIGFNPIINPEIAGAILVMSSFILLGPIYGYNGIPVLALLLEKRLDRWQFYLGLILLSMIAHVLTLPLLYLGCYILPILQYEPLLCGAAGGYIYELIFVFAPMTLMGAYFGSLWLIPHQDRDEQDRPQDRDTNSHT